MEALASGDNDHCTFVLINCAGAGGAPGFAAQVIILKLPRHINIKIIIFWPSFFVVISLCSIILRHVDTFQQPMYQQNSD